VDGEDSVLVHGPPAFYLDLGGRGCKFRLRDVRRREPRLLVCGHIHVGYGQGSLSYWGVQEAWEEVALRGSVLWGGC